MKGMVRTVGEPGDVAELMKEREARAMALAGRESGFAIETLSDEEFTDLLARDKRREMRVKEIILNRLEEGIDYGTVPGIPKAFPWEGAADQLLKLFRWTCQPIKDPTLHFDGEVLTASVTVGVVDLAGRLIHSVTRACSTRERRFQNQKSKKWKFDDPRETANECIAMAFKRAKIAATCSASGAKRYFVNPDQLVDDEEAAEAERTRPLSEQERKALVEKAKAAGVQTRETWAALLKEAIPGYDGQRAITVAEAATVETKLKSPAAKPSPIASAGKFEPGEAAE